MSEKEKQMNI